VLLTTYGDYATVASRRSHHRGARTHPGESEPQLFAAAGALLGSLRVGSYDPLCISPRVSRQR